MALLSPERVERDQAVTLRLSTEEKRLLIEFAKTQDRPLGALCRRLIFSQLEGDGRDAA